MLINGENLSIDNYVINRGDIIETSYGKKIFIGARIFINSSGAMNSPFPISNPAIYLNKEIVYGLEFLTYYINGEMKFVYINDIEIWLKSME